MRKTTIQWCWRQLPNGTWVEGHSFNPWWGCLKVADECKHCYAEGIAHHYGHEVWGPAATTSRRLFGEDHWREPLTWNRQAERQGHRHSVFCASMADVFEEHPTIVNEREKLWQLINATPWLNWILLTKRAGNVLKLSLWGTDWPDNVWVGTSAGTQKRADEEIPLLLDVPAVVRLVSVEPQLEAIDLRPYLKRLQWAICGGESGPNARRFDLNWACSLRDQCLAAGVPYFFKQVGGRYHDSGGRVLDGRTWDAMPPEMPEQSAQQVPGEKTSLAPLSRLQSLSSHVTPTAVDRRREDSD
jgi:protein gp37